MKRGFPRPILRVEKITSMLLYHVADPERFSNKNYPLPYSSRRDRVDELYGGRVMECVIFKKCIVCGEGVKGDKVYIYRNDGNLQGDSGPFHEKCMRLTRAMCPVMIKDAERPHQHHSWALEDWKTVKPKILVYANREYTPDSTSGK